MLGIPESNPASTVTLFNVIVDLTTISINGKYKVIL